MTTFVLRQKKKSTRRGMHLISGRVDPDRVLAALKLKAPERPIRTATELMDPTLPPDITKLTDTHLGALYGEFCVMAQYIGPQAAIKAMAAAAAKRTDKITRSMTHLAQRGTVADKAASVETDPRVLQTSQALLVAESEAVLVSSLLESYLIGKDALSREQTRRQKIGETTPTRRGP